MIRIETKKIQEALTILEKVKVVGSSVLPAYWNILLEIKGNKAYATASNGEVTVKSFFPIESEECETIMIDSSVFVQTIKLLKTKEIQLELITQDNGTKDLIVTSGKTKRYELPVEGGEEGFPKSKKDDEPTIVSLDINQLSLALKRCQGFTDTKSIQMYAGYINVKSYNDFVTVTATNGTIISHHQIENTNCGDFEFNLTPVAIDILDGMSSVNKVQFEIRENNRC